MLFRSTARATSCTAPSAGSVSCLTPPNRRHNQRRSMLGSLPPFVSAACGCGREGRVNRQPKAVPGGPPASSRQSFDSNAHLPRDLRLGHRPLFSSFHPTPYNMSPAPLELDVRGQTWGRLRVRSPFASSRLRSSPSPPPAHRRPSRRLPRSSSDTLSPTTCSRASGRANAGGRLRRSRRTDLSRWTRRRRSSTTARPCSRG